MPAGACLMINTPMPPVARILLVTAATALAAIMLQAVWPMVPWSAIAGTKPGIEVFALLLGPVGGIAAVAGLFLNFLAQNKTYRQTRESTQVATFSRGAEMLAGDAEAKALAGVAILQQVALDSPHLQTAVLNTLAGYVTERCRDNYEGIGKLQIGELLGQPATPASVLNAISVISGIYFPVRGREPFPVNKVFLSQWEVTEQVFGAISLRNGFLGDVIFRSCSFIRAWTSCRVGRGLRFEACMLQHADIILEDLGGSRIKPEEKHLVEFVNIAPEHRTGCRINGMPLDDWIAASAGPPPLIDTGVRPV